jgi:hypothetical protein
MSLANVDVVREALDAYARRDLDAMRALNDPELFTVRNRRVTRICLYQETQQALEAVGVRE